MSLLWEKFNFKSEYVDGFYVMEMVKRSWAAQLEVYDVIRNICKKHDISFFADWGTLLGAVRHNGFVPWDDDMDIGMKRKDLMKFLEVAGAELPEGFILLSPYCNSERDNIITRVVNSGGINFSEEFLNKFHMCPYVVGIDIFPVDIIPRDKEKMEQQRMLLNYMREINDYVILGTIKDQELEDICSTVSEVLGVSLSKNMPVKQRFYIYWDQICGMYSEEDGEYLSSIYDFAAGWDYRIPKEEYAKFIDWNFMNTSVPVPVGYDHILRVKYRNYEKKRIGGSSHAYPVFREQGQLLMEYINSNDIQVNKELLRLLSEIKYNGDVIWPVAKADLLAIKRDGYLYVDKTNIIEKVLSDDNRVQLIFQPAKSGKTLALNTIATYVGASKIAGKLNTTETGIFYNTYIEKLDENNNRRSKVVLGIGFDNIAAKTLDEWKYGFHREIWNLCFYSRELFNNKIYDEHGDLVDNNLLSLTDQKIVQNFIEMEGRGFNWLEALEIVIKVNSLYLEQPVWIMIDAYDSFLKQAEENGFGKEALEEFETFTSKLISMDVVEKILVFGRGPVETKKLFDVEYDLSNSVEQRKYFYWNESEVEKILEMFGQLEEMKVVSEHYRDSLDGDNGYSYNPWNIINYTMSIARGAKEPFQYQKICGEMDH